MITEGGERGKQFEEAYQYLAGYLSWSGREAGASSTSAGDLDDPFHKLLRRGHTRRQGTKTREEALHRDRELPQQQSRAGPLVSGGQEEAGHAVDENAGAPLGAPVVVSSPEGHGQMLVYL